MVRSKAGDKRTAIVEAAISLIADEGVSTTTGAVAKLAGVAHGSVFHYFETKADLLNAVYAALTDEICEATLSHVPDGDDPVAQMKHLWERWIAWANAAPKRHRAIVRLKDEKIISQETRDKHTRDMERAIRIVQAVAADGVFKNESIDFVARFFDALALATIKAMLSDPDRASDYRETSFQALVKALR